MSIIIAIDHGNSAIKTPFHQFCSGISEHLVRPPMADELIEYGGKFWTLSSNRISYKRDKTTDNRFFILSLFAIAKELKSRRDDSMFHTVNLAVGLPPEHFGQGRDEFAAYFKHSGSVNFTYNDEAFTVVIDKVFVYPQAYAAVASQADKLDLRNTPRIFVVDIGGMTVDVMLLRNGKPDLHFCRSLMAGIITMQNDLIGKVNSRHDMTIEDDHIADVLLERKSILTDEVQETIRASCRQHADNVLDKLRELQVDLRSNPAIFTGGGSILLRPFIEQSSLVSGAEFVTKTNAIGYQMLADAQMKRMP